MREVASEIKSVSDARYFAERRVPKLVRDYMRAGSGTKVTLSRNTSAFDEVSLRPRAAVSPPERELGTTVLGHDVSMPVMIAPTGGGRLVHPDGELGGVRAAGSAGTIQWVTTFAGIPIEDITAAAPGPVFFQLYYPGSREAAEELIDRVKAAGCTALALTIDTIVGPRPEVPARGRITVYRAGATGRRPIMEYLRIATQLGIKPRWTARFLLDRGRGLRAAMVTEGGKPALLFRASEILMQRPPVWEDLDWIRERWGGPFVVKGIMTPEDARKAVELGADAIVVSNHGGNVLDGNASTISVLPSIVKAVDGRAEVLLDSGIRRGSDVVKAMAMGAKAVLVGRSWLWGVAAAGEAGVSAVLEVYRRQIMDTMASLGVSSVDELNESHVTYPEAWKPAP